MKMITIWRQVNEDGSTKLNHIEDGWTKSEHPEPKSERFTNQTAWKNMKWERKNGLLTDDFKVLNWF